MQPGRGPDEHGWTSHPPAGGGPAGERPASVGERALARILDSIILGVVVFVGVVGVVLGSVIDDDYSLTEVSLDSFASNAIAAVLGLAYYAVLESTRGQTVGKMALGIEVRRSDGNHPTVADSVKRNAWMLLTLVPVIGPVAQLAAVVAIAVTITNNPAGRGWHDELAGTAVVKT